MKNLEDRVYRLERGSSRFRFLLGSVVLTTTVALWVGAAQDDTVPDIIRAHAFEVVDDEGRVRIALHGLANSASIEIFNREGSPVVTIMGTTKFGGIATYDGQGGLLVRIESITVGTDDIRTGAVTVFDATNRRRLVTLDGDRNGGVIRLMNSLAPVGTPVCILGVDEEGDGVLSILDHQMKGRRLTPEG